MMATYNFGSVYIYVEISVDISISYFDTQLYARILSNPSSPVIHAIIGPPVKRFRWCAYGCLLCLPLPSL